MAEVCKCVSVQQLAAASWSRERKGDRQADGQTQGMQTDRETQAASHTGIQTNQKYIGVAFVLVTLILIFTQMDSERGFCYLVLVPLMLTMHFLNNVVLPRRNAGSMPRLACYIVYQVGVIWCKEGLRAVRI